MMSFRNLVLIVVAISAAMGFVLGGASFHSGRISGTDTSDGTAVPDGSDNLPATAAEETTSNSSDSGGTHWSHGRDGSDVNAQEHWLKHGRDFSADHNEREYADDAQSFVDHPPSDAEIKHRSNGDTLIYDPDTNIFAVENRDGELRTIFKPDRGRAYWDRQH